MNWHLRRAADTIRHGGVIAYPTETVYGLGCDPFNGIAVLRLLELKIREWRKGLILVAADFEQILPLIQVDDPSHLAKTIAQENAVVTWVVPANPQLPQWIRGEHDSIAVRISRHKLVNELCRILHQPIVSTSANPSTLQPATNALQVQRYFGKQLDYILHSDKPCNMPPSQLLRYPSRQRLR